MFKPINVKKKVYACGQACYWKKIKDNADATAMQEKQHISSCMRNRISIFTRIELLDKNEIF